MAQPSDTAGQCRISWSIFEDNITLKEQRESTLKSGSLYPPLGPYELNGYAGDATIVRKTTNQGEQLKVIATTNGLGAKQRSLFPKNIPMAVEALKLEYKLGPVLAADLNIGNPRETPTGVKGLFFGTVAVVAEERLLPGDKVMVTFTDPSKSAKAYGKGRTGTARNTRRPLIYVKYTPTVSSTRLLTHIRAVLTDPKLYAQIAQSNKKSAQAWMNAVRTIFADDMLKISLAMRVLTQRRLFRPDESAGELFGTNGEELSSDEITIRMAQWLHAIPMTRRTQDIRDRSNNGSAGWEQTYIDILNTIYFDGKNKAYEFGYRVRGNTAESDARDLTTGHLRGTEAGNVLYMQINSATQRLTAEFAADNDTKSWVRGVTIVGGRQGSNAVLLITQTQL